MSLKDALQAQRTNRGKPKCVTCRLLASLDKDDREALQEALDSDLSAAAIARALQAEGHMVRDQSVGRHRRRECVA